MKNLSKAENCKELSVDEIQSINGGIWWAPIIFAAECIAGGMGYEYLSNSKECNAAFREGFNKGLNTF